MDSGIYKIKANNEYAHEIVYFLQFHVRVFVIYCYITKQFMQKMNNL